jgi:hypothetical protein
MRVHIVTLVLCLLVATPAWADPSVLGATARIPETSQVQLFGGTREFGAGVVLPDGRNGESAEVAYNPWDSVLQARAQRLFTLVRHDVFGLTAQVGGSLIGVLQGPPDLGIGPEAGLVTGWGWRHVNLDLGAQAGADWFFRSGGPRFPLRLLLTVGVHWGDWGGGVMGRAGADLESGYYPALRYEALLFLRWGGWGPRFSSGTHERSTP